ncbi:hypothetical protein EVAR_61224_1 [Eumeta japonica]|uniref:Uncharacterized protein n=1 Tax=Eumeta variegata TaxID=151549 RepID=A0A4C1Z7F0_EUMVA|nr:hypothetical protein EVAR_61224_1 [Eumeta japonica]
MQTARRLLGHRGNNYSNCEPMLRGAPRRSVTLPGRGPEREEEDSGSLTRAASGAAAESPVRAASTWSAFIGVRRAAVVCMRRSSTAPPPPPSSTTASQPGAPPTDAERMRGDARARGWSGVGTGLTSRPRMRQNEEVEGHGSLTRTALAAAVRRVDSLISGRQARSVRSTPTRVTDACRLDPVGIHQRPTTGGRLRVQLELASFPPLVEHQPFTPDAPLHLPAAHAQ